jgi:hypothetical protein
MKEEFVCAFAHISHSKNQREKKQLFVCLSVRPLVHSSMSKKLIFFTFFFLSNFFFQYFV